MNPLLLKDLVYGQLGFGLLADGLLAACSLQFARCWLFADAGCLLIAAHAGCLLMQELLLDFLPIYEAFAFIVELKA